MPYFDYAAVKRDGGKHSPSEHAGKTLPIVNAATGCGPVPQCEGLKRLYTAIACRAIPVILHAKHINRLSSRLTTTLRRPLPCG